MSGSDLSTVAWELLTGTLVVACWAVVAALLALLFRAAFGRRHCRGCSCKTWDRAEVDEPDIRDGDDEDCWWPAEPVGLIDSDTRPSHVDDPPRSPAPWRRA